MNRREVGTKKEQLVVCFLKKQGVRVLETNYRSRVGEIDIIGWYREYLIFFEVKYRKNHSLGYPEEAVNFYKQKRICRVADFYRYSHKIAGNVAIRYDVLAIEGEEVRWIKNAFPHIS